MAVILTMPFVLVHSVVKQIPTQVCNIRGRVLDLPDFRAVAGHGAVLTVVFESQKHSHFCVLASILRI